MSIVRHRSNARMSQAVVHNGVAYFSGQIADGANVIAQAEAIFGQIEELLEIVGASKETLLSATIWLADLADLATFNQLWEEWLAEVAAPARATTQANLVAPQFKVEIAITAACG